MYVSRATVFSLLKLHDWQQLKNASCRKIWTNIIKNKANKEQTMKEKACLIFLVAVMIQI